MPKLIDPDVIAFRRAVIRDYRDRGLTKRELNKFLRLSNNSMNQFMQRHALDLRLGWVSDAYYYNNHHAPKVEQGGRLVPFGSPKLP